MPGEIPQFEIADVEQIEPIEPIEPILADADVEKDPQEIYAERMEALMNELQAAHGNEVQPKNIIHAQEIVRSDGSRAVVWNGKEISADGFDDDSHELMKEHGFKSYADFNSGSIFLGTEFNERGELVTSYQLIQFENTPKSEEIFDVDPEADEAEQVDGVDPLVETETKQSSPLSPFQEKPWFWEYLMNNEVTSQVTEQTSVEPAISSEQDFVGALQETTVAHLESVADAPLEVPNNPFSLSQKKEEARVLDTAHPLTPPSPRLGRGEQLQMAGIPDTVGANERPQEPQIFTEPIPAAELLPTTKKEGIRVVDTEIPSTYDYQELESEVGISGSEGISRVEQTLLHFSEDLSLSGEIEQSIDVQIPTELTFTAEAQQTEKVELRTDAATDPLSLDRERAGVRVSNIEGPIIHESRLEGLETTIREHTGTTSEKPSATFEFRVAQESSVIQESVVETRLPGETTREVVPIESAIEHTVPDAIETNHTSPERAETTREYAITRAEVAHLPVVEASVIIEQAPLVEFFTTASPEVQRLVEILQAPAEQQSPEIVLVGEQAPNGEILDATIVKTEGGRVTYEFRAVATSVEPRSQAAIRAQFEQYEWVVAPTNQSEPSERVLTVASELTPQSFSRSESSVASEGAPPRVELENNKPWPGFIGDPTDDTERNRPSTQPTHAEVGATINS